MINIIKKWQANRKLWKEFKLEFHKLKELDEKSTIPSGFKMEWEDIYPQLFDRTGIHNYDHHYLYFPAWAARKLAHIKPLKHVDISSKLYFSAIVSGFVPVDFYDYRPAEIVLANMRSLQADVTALPFEDNTIESISCMHVVEHIGLGRYGDPLDPQGDTKSFKELSRVVKPGGYLIFVTPVGSPKIEFNAHRIYSYEQIVKSFSNLELKEFSLVTDDLPGKAGELIQNADPSLVSVQKYGCGCFLFQKPLNA